MKDGFVFYRSWWEAIVNLPRDVQGDVLTAIVEYGLNGETTEQLKPIAAALLAMVRPQIDANNHRYENGKKGGRPKAESNQTETKTKPNNNQTKTKLKPNDNQTETKTKPKDKDKDIYKENSTIVESKKAATKVAATLSERESAFYESLVPYVGKYGKEMIRSFFNYWSQPNSSGTKLGFEMEKKWDLAKRLALWASKENNYTHGNNNRSADKSAKAQQLISEYAAIEQGLDVVGDKVKLPDL